MAQTPPSLRNGLIVLIRLLTLQVEISRKELLKKSDGVIRNTLSMMDNRWTDNAIITKLCQDFSSLSTMNRAREELKNLYQEPGEPITVFIYKYGQMHYLLYRY